MERKVCTLCKEVKKKDEFYKRECNRLKSWCITCCNKKSKVYFEIHPDKLKQYNSEQKVKVFQKILNAA